MREIKFRGKKKSDNQWIVGDLNHIYGKVYIFDRETSLNSTDDYEVHPETVGQFTGLTDKNGVEIYKGDLVRNSVAMFYVCFEKGVFGVRLCGEKPNKSLYNLALRGVLNIEVIGNIHETETL